MLIEIINTDAIDLNDEALHPTLINLLCAYREGKHLLLCDATLLKKISVHTELGNLTCNTAKFLSSRIIEYVQLKEKLTYYCKVDLSSSSTEAIHKNPQDNFFTVGYKYFSDSANIQIPKLLCEDLNDTKLYNLISKHYRLSNGFRGIDVKFENCNGGGANTKHNFEMIKQSSKLCLCLLDSDKKHPKSNVGSTASKFNKRSDSATCKHYIMECHEIESLIPLGVIEIGLKNKIIQNSYIFAFEQFHAVTNYKPNTKLYFDHKEGLTISSATEMDEKYNDDYWLDVLKNAQTLRKKGCLDKLHCECTPPCLAIPGFGTGLLDAGTSIIEKMTHLKLTEILPPILLAEWQKIGLKLTSWGCSSPNRTRTS
ncbi:TPA: hypothetical protein R8G77_001360 [Citrobacter freundii]|nr:hypothetical protein [Citrobacter freundii]HEF0012490.1 hypothetical protein [Citrobacter freundii]